MKNLIIISTIFLLMSVSYQFTYAQWVQRYNGPGNGTDAGNSIAVDVSGNVYVTGSSLGIGTGFSDYATIKYNSSGVQQWIQRYNGPENGNDVSTSIAVDGLGNIYVTGESNFIGPFGGGDYATIKYNSSGVQQWVQRYNWPGNGRDNATSIAVDVSGNVYVTGSSLGIGTNIDYATIKYNSSGIQQWVQRYNTPANTNDQASSIAVDSSGNVYVTGGSATSGTNIDYATIKYNSSGVQQWVQRYNGQGLGKGGDFARSIAIDGSGNIYVTGESWGIGIDYDYATIKYNSNGDSIWVKRYNGPVNGGDYAESIAIDGSGNVYVTGFSDMGFGNYDYATIKYNSSGVQQWVQTYNGSGNGFDSPHSIAVDGSGNVYVTGSSWCGTDHDYATIKYNSSGAQQWVQRYNGPGNNNDFANSIEVDGLGNVYVTGSSVGIGTNSDYATIKYLQQPIPALDLTALIEGFYNNSTNTVIRDTVWVYLRNVSSPYLIVDSAKSLLDSTGYGRFNFPNAVYGTLYYIVVKHRNSIETWSSQGKMFSGYQLSYDFVTNASKAYGNNLVLKGSRYCIYSGDINQDGIIDAGDLSPVDNDAFNSVSGYVNTDVTGDNSVDASDLLVVDNNAFKGVIMITP